MAGLCVVPAIVVPAEGSSTCIVRVAAQISPRLPEREGCVQVPIFDLLKKFDGQRVADSPETGMRTFRCADHPATRCALLLSPRLLHCAEESF